MPKLKLTYFDFHGGRGEVARIALNMAGIPFEDDRVSSEWPERKSSTPYGALPVLEVDGELVAQSNGINRFVGKLAKLYPEDPLQAAFCDEAMDAIEDIAAEIEATIDLPQGEEKKRVRQELAEGPISFYLRALEARLARRGGRWFADDRVTVADLKVFLWVRHLKSGILDHVPVDLPDRVAPALVEHWNRVKAEPRVAAYYRARGIE
jgi:prostaglandin-H2 D-isomerase / glutathione transferase